MTALLVQDSMWSRHKSRPTRRVLDGVVFGAGMTVAVLLMWAIDKIWNSPVMESLDQASAPVMILGVFVATFAFGFVIGYLVITRIRESSSSYLTGPTRTSDETVLSMLPWLRRA